MPFDRLGGLKLEPIPFLDEWIPAEATDTEREILLERVRSIQVFRFFYPSGPNIVEGFLVEPKEGTKLPCIVYVRGGFGDYGLIHDEFLWTSKMSRFAAAGYCVIATQFSGAGNSDGLDDEGGEQTFNDVYRLHDLLVADSRADVGRIGTFGGSRGGIHVYQLMRFAPWLKAAVTISGVSSHASTGFRPAMEAHVDKLFRNDPEGRRFRSAIEWADAFLKHVPLLLLHGTADWRVNPMDTLALAQRCQQEKVPYRLVMYEGGDHRLSQFAREPYRLALDWFNRFVRDGEPVPVLEPFIDDDE